MEYRDSAGHFHSSDAFLALTVTQASEPFLAALINGIKGGWAFILGFISALGLALIYYWIFLRGRPDVEELEPVRTKI